MQLRPYRGEHLLRFHLAGPTDRLETLVQKYGATRGARERYRCRTAAGGGDVPQNSSLGEKGLGPPGANAHRHDEVEDEYSVLGSRHSRSDKVWGEGDKPQSGSLGAPRAQKVRACPTLRLSKVEVVCEPCRCLRIDL